MTGSSKRVSQQKYTVIPNNFRLIDMLYCFHKHKPACGTVFYIAGKSVLKIKGCFGMSEWEEL